MGSRRLFALLAAGAVALLPLGAASASTSTAKRIAYVSGTTLATIGANGTGTSNLGVTANNPSFSSDGQLIAYDDATKIFTIPAAGGSATERCTGTDPALSPNSQKVAYVSTVNTVKVNDLACATGTPVDLGAGTAPAWSPDGTQIVFVDGNGDLAVAPSAGGAAQKLGATTAVESAPSWSPDAGEIAYAAGDEIFVMNADGSNRRQLTTNAVVDSSPSWAPGGDEIVYASDGKLLATTPSGSATRVLADAAGAKAPSWSLAVANTAPPTITPQSGAAIAEGTSLSASVGSWISISGITSWSYQWKRCGSAGAGCVDISGATSGTYTLANGDVGSTIRVRVVASTADGSAPALSVPTAVVGASGPANITPPTISGTAIVGGQLTATTGTWAGSNPVFTYRWQKCDASGAESSCTDIPGATFNVYVATQNDVGATLRVLVKATNSLSSAERASLPTPVVVSNVPAVVSPPAIGATMSATGAVTSLTATNGVWSGAATITFRYQWRRCDANGASCRDIAGAVSSIYTPAAADIGARLRVAVTATNNFGTTTAVSEPSELLAGTAPENTFRPSISGLENAGSVLSASTGTWTGSTPLTYTYQWRRCNAIGAACSSIPGATASSYVVQAADAGFTIVVAVTAKNAAGTAAAESGPTDVITAGTSPGATAATRPNVTTAPSIRGTLARGQRLRAVNGQWTGTTPMTFSYQWQRCAATGTVCTAISLATRATYLLTAADVGRRIRLVVTAANVAGSAQATTAITARVAATARAAGLTLRGTARADRLAGRGGNDTIRGAGGNDRIDGSGGNDALYGDAGDDSITGGAGADRIFGGSGNDRISAADGRRDVVVCGPGRDTVVADRVDVVRGCERVTRRR